MRSITVKPRAGTRSALSGAKLLFNESRVAAKSAKAQGKGPLKQLVAGLQTTVKLALPVIRAVTAPSHHRDGGEF